ncbi:hypothetical protein ABVK25_010763 [Lepraria finkii]|uniref:Uncharacterized protein n=1 Tax=Lepraria finkii TaxID=1340010 RepID=A0ABR4AW11_9LECA
MAEQSNNRTLDFSGVSRYLCSISSASTGVGALDRRPGCSSTKTAKSCQIWNPNPTQLLNTWLPVNIRRSLAQIIRNQADTGASIRVPDLSLYEKNDDDGHF